MSCEHKVYKVFRAWQRRFPEEKEHQRANKDYFQFHLAKIKELPKPIPSLRWRRIVRIPTSCEKLFTAERKGSGLNI